MAKRMMISDYVKKEIEEAEDLPFLPYSNVSEYAKYIGVSHTVVQDMIKGKYNSPSPITAVRMCRWFGFEPNELFDMINIKGNKDKYLDSFYDKYNGADFKQRCTNALMNFVNGYDKFGKNGITFGFKQDAKVSTLTNLKLVNTNESSIYDPKAYNATCDYELHVVGHVQNGNEVEHLTTKLMDYTCMLYYLPARRIRKQSSYTYADEEIRDFVNKFMYLIKAKHAPVHNLFITHSKLVYDNIVKYLGDLHITPTISNLGIILVYQPKGYAYNSEFKIIIDNDDEMYKGLLLEEDTLIDIDIE